MVFSAPYAEGILILFIVALAPQALSAFCFLLNQRVGPIPFDSSACTASADAQQIPCNKK